MLTATPEDIFESKELRVMFWGAVWSMPPRLRCVITHLYVCDRTHEEAALLLNVTTEALELLHYGALANLKERVTEWQLQ